MGVDKHELVITHGCSTLSSHIFFYTQSTIDNLNQSSTHYNSTVEPAYVDYPQDASDFVQKSPYGGIDLPSDEFYKIHALSSRHPPSSRPSGPPKPPFRP